ncbi:MAG TPA: heme-degrading domain-containing protein [Eubacteriaceae bacterium]|jgi:uncharacterized protein (UPF0303 family)|nr:heme-degrading domain-containing protein [Eubacteriaceae bacterium]
MDKLDIKMNEVLDTEKDLVFEWFTSQDALKLGMLLIEKGKEAYKPIAINISVNRRCLFHYSFDGALPDNDNWIARKENVVYRFYKSSFFMELKLKKENKTVEEKYGTSLSELAPYGGSVPIVLKKTGVVGAVTVSGLNPEDDHALVVECIKEYLSK